MKTQIKKSSKRDLINLVSDLDAEKPPVLIFRANDICSLGIAKAIAAVNFQAIWVSYDWARSESWFSEKSIFYRNVFKIDNPAEKPEKAAEQLEHLGYLLKKKYHKKILTLFSSDTVQQFFFLNKHKFMRYFDVYGDNTYKSYRTELSNKAFFFNLLSKNLPELCPKTLSMENEDNVKDIFLSLGRPFILKPAVKDPAQTFYRLHNGKKAVEISSYSALQKKVHQCRELNIPLVAQERIRFGNIENEVPFYCYFDRKHDLKIVASGKKLIVQPELYGTATVLQLTHNPFLVKYAKKIGKLLKWSGPLMIEFMKDSETYQWKVIEINTRPWLFHDFYRQNNLPFIGAAVLDHYDYQNGTNLLSRLISSQELTYPRVQNDHRIVHIDLKSIVTHICENTKRTSNYTRKIIEQILKYGDSITFAYGDIKDLRPINHIISECCLKYDLEPLFLQSFIFDCLKSLSPGNFTYE